MDIEYSSPITGARRRLWERFLARAGITPSDLPQETVLLLEEGEPIATGSRDGCLLKYIAVDPARQGEGLSATLLTALRRSAFEEGHRHLFLYTKPENERLFSALFFYPIARTDRVLLMEDKKDGIRDFLASLPQRAAGGSMGAAVMNCNPFTRGHRHLVEAAAAECDHVLLFVLSEDKSLFSTEDRMEMVRRGTADIGNVTVLPTGPYLVSSATFPTYFLKDRDRASEAQCLLDIEIFVRYFVPRFGITHRYVGTEPLSPLTNLYNAALREHLPPHGIAYREVPRLEEEGVPISASAVRARLASGEWEAACRALPPSTRAYLEEMKNR